MTEMQAALAERLYGQTEAGNAMDAEIASRIFGRDVVYQHSLTYTDRGWRYGDERSDGKWVIPAYSTDIAAAWQIIEHFQDAGWLVQLRCEPNRENTAADFFRFHDDPPDDETGDVFAPTMPLAICRAALQCTKESVTP